MPYIMKYILLIFMSAVIIAAWIVEPPQSQLGSVSRIFYFHVPAALISVIAFGFALYNSIAYLKTKEIKHDFRSASSVELGLMFCILATISGAVFAKAAWGAYWNWDPRQTSIFVLILIYGAYLALRSALDNEERRASLSAVYAILAFITVPFLVFVVPRIYPSLHPEDTIVGSGGEMQLTGMVAAIFWISMVCFAIIFYWLYSLQSRIELILRNRLKEI